MIDDNMTYFQNYLPAVEITPTILGGMLIALLIMVLLIILIMVLYCFNSSIKAMFQMYLCCKKREVDTIIQIVEKSNDIEYINAKLEDDSTSVKSFSQMTAFSRN